MSLQGDVVVQTAQGDVFRTDKAVIDTVQGSVAGPSPVTGSGPTGEISARTFGVYDRGARFAGKEAVVKAMGTGFAHGMWIRDVGIVQNSWGKPEVIYSGCGQHLREKLGIGDCHITLTDEAGLVVAVAVLLKASTGQPGI